MGPYRLVEGASPRPTRSSSLRSSPDFPRLIVIEPLSPTFEDKITRWNNLYPLAAASPTPATSARSTRPPRSRPSATRSSPRASASSTPATRWPAVRHRPPALHVPVGPHLQPGGLRRRRPRRPRRRRVRRALSSPPPSRPRSTPPPACKPQHEIADKVLGLDHMATRILAGDREDAILEYLTMVPYYFWGAYNITEMNSSTNVTRTRPSTTTRSRRPGCSPPTTRRRT